MSDERNNRRIASASRKWAMAKLMREFENDERAHANEINRAFYANNLDKRGAYNRRKKGM